jgi:phage-related protein
MILRDPTMIGNIFSLIFGWLSSLWKSIPEETKDAAIEAMVEAFVKILKSFYQQTKTNEEENENA